MLKLKRLSIYFLSAMLIGAMASCTDDEEDGPVVTPQPSITSLSITPTSSTESFTGNFNAVTGESVNIVATFQKGDRNLDIFELFVSGVADQSATEPIVEENISGSNDQVNFSILMPAEAGSYQYTFKVTENGGDNFTERTVTATVSSPDGGSDTELEVVTLGSFGSSTGSFYNISERAVYSISQANNNVTEVDFAYAFGVETEANIFSLTDPITSEFFGGLTATGTRKATAFKPATANDYALDLLSEIEAAYGAATGETTRLTELSTNNYFFVRTSGGETFVVQVTNVNAGADGDISLSIKGVF